jgi:hypothetical protein
MKPFLSNHAAMITEQTASPELDPEIEAAWEAEADLREAQLASGEAVCVDGETVLAQLWARINPDAAQTRATGQIGG